MNAEEARQLIPLYREEKATDSRVVKAARFAEDDETLRTELQAQMDFDRQMVEVVRYINPPTDLWEKLNQLGTHGRARRSKSRQFLNPAILCAVVGVLLLIGFAAWRIAAAADDFPGRSRVESFIKLNERMTGAELDPTQSAAGQLADNMMLQGFNGFVLPEEIAPLPALFWRVFREAQSGHRVAQFVVEHQNTVVSAFVFRASDFGVQPDAVARWRTFDFDGWAAAITERNGMCTVLTFRGDEVAMKKFLSSLKP
jgi:hypothetical protein